MSTKKVEVNRRHMTSLYIPLFLPQVSLIMPQTQCAHSYALHNQIPARPQSWRPACVCISWYGSHPMWLATNWSNLGFSGGIRGCEGCSQVLHHSASMNKSMSLVINSSWLTLCLHLHRTILRISQATITPSSTIPVHRLRIYPAQPMFMHGTRYTVWRSTVNSIAPNKPNSI